MPPRRSRSRTHPGRGAVRSPIARVVAPVSLADGDEWAVVSRERLAEAAVDRLHEVAPELDDALGAERLGSQVPALWWQHGLGRRLRHEIEEDVGTLIADGLEDLGGHAALCGLRTLALAGGGDGLRVPAEAAAERLRAAGTADPAWWARVAEVRPTGARRITQAMCPGDVMLVVQFDRAGEPAHTLIASVRAEQGGTMGLLETGPSFARLDAAFEDPDRECDELELPREPGLEPRTAPIDPAEAGAMIRKAIRRTDALGTAGPVEDYIFIRGLAARRAELLCGDG